MPTSFIDPELAFQASDLVFRARRVDGRAAYVYCLVEHKSYADPLVGLQLLRYMVRLWDYMLRQEKEKPPLAPINPLVFYHGARRWNAPEDFAHLIAGSDALNHYTPRFRYVLIDLNAEPVEGIEDDPILAVTLDALRYGFDRKVMTLASILTVLEALRQRHAGETR